MSESKLFSMMARQRTELSGQPEVFIKRGNSMELSSISSSHRGSIESFASKKTALSLSVYDKSSTKDGKEKIQLLHENGRKSRKQSEHQKGGKTEKQQKRSDSETRASEKTSSQEWSNVTVHKPRTNKSRDRTQSLGDKPDIGHMPETFTEKEARKNNREEKAKSTVNRESDSVDGKSHRGQRKAKASKEHLMTDEAVRQSERREVSTMESGTRRVGERAQDSKIKPGSIDGNAAALKGKERRKEYAYRQLNIPLGPSNEHPEEMENNVEIGRNKRKALNGVEVKPLERRLPTVSLVNETEDKTYNDTNNNATSTDGKILLKKGNVNTGNQSIKEKKSTEETGNIPESGATQASMLTKESEKAGTTKKVQIKEEEEKANTSKNTKEKGEKAEEEKDEGPPRVMDIFLDHELLTEMLEVCHTAFDEFDTKNKHAIPIADLPKAMRLVGLNPTEDEHTEVMAALELEEKDKITLDQFLKVAMTTIRLMDSEDEVRKVFKIFDRDNNGKLSKNELMVMLRMMGEDVEDSALNEIIGLADTNNDGELDYEEFVNMLCSY